MRSCLPGSYLSLEVCSHWVMFCQLSPLRDGGFDGGTPGWPGKRVRERLQSLVADWHPGDQECVMQGLAAPWHGRPLWLHRCVPWGQPLMQTWVGRSCLCSPVWTSLWRGSLSREEAAGGPSVADCLPPLSLYEKAKKLWFRYCSTLCQLDFQWKKKSLTPNVDQVSLCLFLCSNFSYFNLNGRASSSLGFCQLLMSPIRQSMCYWLFLAWKILRAHVVPFSFNCANLVQFSFTQIVFISWVLYH